MYNPEMLRGKKIGLVLSGGGAKGAYQVGMLRALEELGITAGISALSGTSIGAYAAVIYALRGTEAYRDFLYDFTKLNGKGHILTRQEVDEARALVAAGTAGKEAFWAERMFWQYEGEGLREYFEALLSANPLDNCSVPITVCCYCLERERAEYFPMAGRSDRDRIAAIIGSGSLPYLFRAQEIDGAHYLDGGVIPNVCRTPSAPDKIPLLPMTKEAVDAIIISYLMPGDRVDLSVVPEGVEVIEIRPRVPLEHSPGTGTSDFSPASLAWREELGYEDTMRLFGR